MVKFLDPLISRKSAIVDESFAQFETGVPLPSVVEISESGTCNRTCAFCPRSAPDYPDIKEFVEADLIDKLTRQLAEAGFEGLVLYSGFVEPLLDKNILNIVGRTRKNLPACRIELVTNGDVLNDDRLTALFDAGLSTLLISVYDGPEDAARFQQMCVDANLLEEQYKIRHRYLPEHQDFGITLSNRAGMMANAQHKLATPDSPLDKRCNYPHYTFFMDYNGDVLLCPHDWGKKLVVGNMNESDFIEVWLGPAFTTARRRLADGDRRFSPCNLCDVDGTLIGEEHVRAWASLTDAQS